MKTDASNIVILLSLSSWRDVASAFQQRAKARFHGRQSHESPAGLHRMMSGAESDDVLSDLLTSRLPTSVKDQVRQASESLKRATADGVHRHSLRLLLPITGATELDDWPGGARQQMEAASPLMEGVLKSCTSGADTAISKQIIDLSDGVAALMAQAESAKDDSCTVLLPTADTVKDSVRSLDSQVGEKRNLILVNPQWRRRSDFGGVFGGDDETIAYVEEFCPTFQLTNQICEGDQVRVLRTYPGPWRVFMREEDEDTGSIDWKQIGVKDVLDQKPGDWQQRPENKKDGGILFNYGRPTYPEIVDMLRSAPGYIPKNLTERAAAAVIFIKDTL